jgi:adhesin transport system membrane fusion protein
VTPVPQSVQPSGRLLLSWTGFFLPQSLTQALARNRELRLLWVGAVLLVLLVLWAALAPVDKIVRAQGRIIAAGRAQVVQHLEGGIVQAIMVREGQKVQAGQILMQMSDINANSTLQQGQSRLLALRAQQARLQAEAQGGSPQFTSDIPPALRALEQRAFEERRSRMGSEQSALQQQVAQRSAELREAQARTQSLSAELQLARQQSVMMENLQKKGAASQMEMLDAQGRSERLNTQYRDVVNSLPRLLSAQAETNARLNEASARFRAEARTELSQVSAEIQRFEATVGADTDRVSRTEVRAPTAGFVNRLYFNTLGGVIKAGEPVLEITPSEGLLAVEARVRPDDRAALRVGLPTRVMLGAYDYTVYGALDGEVTEVSSDTLPDEQGQRYYRVVVQTAAAKGALSSEIILPGMTASADVVVGQRSVLSYVLSPFLRFSARALSESR